MKNLVENLKKSEINLSKCFEVAKTLLNVDIVCDFKGYWNNRVKIAVDIFTFKTDIIDSRNNYPCGLTFPVIFSIKRETEESELYLEIDNSVLCIEGDVDFYNNDELGESFDIIKKDYYLQKGIIKSLYQEFIGEKEIDNTFAFPITSYSNYNEIEEKTLVKLEENRLYNLVFKNGVSVITNRKKAAITVNTKIDKGFDCVKEICFVFIVNK